MPAASEDVPPNFSPLSSPLLSPRSNVPPPNPPFVFPQRPSSSSTQSSSSRSTGRRPRSAIDLQEPGPGFGSVAENENRAPRPSALPDFSFPMAPAPTGESDHNFLSPPQSPQPPQSPRAIPTRPVGHGHRRGGSEFVGGSIRGGDSITVMSTSPTKSENGPPSPTTALSKPSPGGGRRGHSHKRSAAISSHDLSSIILPSPNASSAIRGSSAPASPAMFDGKDCFTFPSNLEEPQQAHSITSPKSEGDIRKASAMAAFPSEDVQQTPKPATRARVGFSDTLEFIPRPLSLVSSDTSSTATARPGHSVSGSISSVISLSTSNITPEREPGSPARPGPALKRIESRPSTAGAVLERTQSVQDLDQASPSQRRRNSIPYLTTLPPTPISPSTPSPTKMPKRWSFFGLEPFVGTSSPTRSRPVSASSSESQSKTAVSAIPPDCIPRPCSAITEAGPVDQKVVSKKRSKKQKKVKSWAGSILSRKSKHRHVKHRRRTHTPPPRAGDIEESGQRPSVELLQEPDMPPLVTVTEATVLDYSAWRPLRTSTSPDEDTSHPMIDLDAALGPFNTPLPRNPEWEAAQRAGGLAKRQLHSAAGMSRFTGPGMHYQHRRAESAPEMVPFEAARFGMHRFNSSSTMADVFEEDEEAEENSDDNNTTGQSTPMAETPVEKSSTLVENPGATGTASTSINADEIPSFPRDIPPFVPGVKRKGSDLSDDEKSQASSRMKSEHTASSLHDEAIARESAHFETPLVPAFESSDSATPSPHQALKTTKDLAPVDVSPLHLPAASLAPISPHSMTQSSAFPSPRSPGSYDTHRISTAPSSITEDNFQSLLLGEPGPEVRISVDDIPSLTSSNSTMTRESAFTHNPQARIPPALHDQPRPASFTSTAFGRRRSSLASLSRLVSSSHGERSKLSMEVSLDSAPEKKPKISKAKRLSRMMQFWKPKNSIQA